MISKIRRTRVYRDSATKFRFAKAFLTSGKSYKEFSKENNLSHHSLRHWVSDYRKTQASNSGKKAGTFIPVDINDSPSEVVLTHQKIEIHYPNGIKLLLPFQTDSSVIKTLTS